MGERTGRVGVLLGGMSDERVISLQSGAAVARALRRRGWDTVEIDVGRDLPARLREEKVDVCWIALHGRYGEDGCVQGVLEVMGIRYTGSGVLASAVAMDKHATKRMVRGCPGIVLADDHLVRSGEPVPDGVALPVVVKPVLAGSTQGITIAHTREDLVRGLAEAFTLGDTVLLEEYVAGDEITVAVLDGDPLPVVRIVPESGFFDFEAKYTKGRTRYEVPAPIPDVVARRAQAAAVEAYRAVGCRGLCRADFIVRADGAPVFLEINTIPGMTETSLSPMAAAAIGMSFDDLVERVLPMPR